MTVLWQTNEYKELVKEVRSVRAMTNICPSAQPHTNVPEILNLLIENKVYKDDCENIAVRILEEDVSYETATDARKIAASGIFEEK